jgi:peptidoglycan/LPS O-acetylase OafA/YrhL
MPVGKKRNNLPTKPSFTLKTSNSAKGIALLLLLWHHLFYEHPEYQQLIFYTSHAAKVCVAIFLILSGYGLAQSIHREHSGILSFYKKRFSHIYLNYWLIALIFVPISIYFFKRPLTYVFDTKPYFNFAIQLLGYHLYFRSIGFGYNPTWWYISVIFGLYWLFPFMLTLLKRFGAWALIPALILLFIGQWDVFGISILNFWIFPFMFGIFISLKNGFERISYLLKKINWVRYLIILILLGLTAFLRHQLILINEFLAIRIDGLFGALIILLVFELTQQFIILEKGLDFLGKHLFNIFLFHTFIFYFFFQDFIYSFKQPVLIFLMLLVICLGISFILELIKKLIGLQKIQVAIDKIPIRDRYVID